MIRIYHVINAQDQTTQYLILGVVVTVCLMTQNKFAKKVRVILWFYEIRYLTLNKQISNY